MTDVSPPSPQPSATPAPLPPALPDPPATPDATTLDAPEPPKPNPRHAQPRLRRFIAVFRARQWAQVGCAAALAVVGLALWLLAHGSALVVPGVALVALAIVSLLGEGPNPSVVVRRPGRGARTPTPSALLWLWCFAALMAAVLAWKSMDLVKFWLEADASRRTDVVITTDSSETKVTAAVGPAP